MNHEHVGVRRDEDAERRMTLARVWWYSDRPTSSEGHAAIRARRKRADLRSYLMVVNFGSMSIGTPVSLSSTRWTSGRSVAIDASSAFAPA